VNLLRIVAPRGDLGLVEIDRWAASATGATYPHDSVRKCTTSIALLCASARGSSNTASSLGCVGVFRVRQLSSGRCVVICASRLRNYVPGCVKRLRQGLTRFAPSAIRPEPIAAPAAAGAAARGVATCARGAPAAGGRGRGLRGQASATEPQEQGAPV